ncbi:MAG: hypothetical protein OEO84_10685, partial [Betaproteobacteria bacterium]|nr:hypothetical protein [Betaproteobacteria bacterium]
VGVPTITGTVSEDQVLTADTSGISDADGLGAFSYQWQRNGVNIAGAIVSTYTLGDADVGTLISVQVSYTDGQGTAEGPLTSAQTAAVANVNDAPTGTANSVALPQDGSYIFGASDFGFSDANDSPANNLLAVRMSTLPAAGALTNNGTAVTAGQLVSAADIGAGLLVFTPAAGGSGAGYASFAFQVRDDGGVASGGVDLDPAARTMTIDVTAVLAPVVPPIVAPPIIPDPLPPPPPPVIVPPDPGSGTSPGLETAPVPAGSRSPSAATGLLLGESVDATRPSAGVQTTVVINPAVPGGLRAAAAAPVNLLRAVALPQLAADDGRMDLDLFGLAFASDDASGGSTLGSQAATGLVQALDRMREELADQGEVEQWVAGSAAVGGFALSVGYVLWLLRGGALLASLLTSLPVWRLIDPLPVLARVDEDESEDEGDDDDAFASFLESGPAAPPAKERA